MDTRTQAWLDQFGAYITEVIRRDGWFIQYVGGKTCLRPGCACPPADDPPFAYTVGMFGLNHPELLIHGVSPETAAGVLNDLGGQILGGSTMMPGETIVLERWGRSIVVESVPNPGEIVYTANQSPPPGPFPMAPRSPKLSKRTSAARLASRCRQPPRVSTRSRSTTSRSRA